MTTLRACYACHYSASPEAPRGHLQSSCQCHGTWMVVEGEESMLQIIQIQHDNWRIPKAKSRHLPGFDATGFGWCWLSSRLCFDMLYIPNNYLPQGVTGSHYNLWCLLRWDIAGFKTGSRPGTTHKKICIHSKHESTSNQPKKTFKELSLSSALFHLAIARHCLMWMLKASFKGRGANIASRVAPNEMSFGFIGGGVMPWIEVI